MITERELEIVNKLRLEKLNIEEYRSGLIAKEKRVVLIENYDSIANYNYGDFLKWNLMSKHLSIEDKLYKATLNILTERLDEINDELRKYIK